MSDLTDVFDTPEDALRWVRNVGQVCVTLHTIAVAHGELIRRLIAELERLEGSSVELDAIKSQLEVVRAQVGILAAPRIDVGDIDLRKGDS